DLSPFKPFPRPPHLGPISGPVPNEPRHDGEQPRPSAAAAVAGAIEVRGIHHGPVIASAPPTDLRSLSTSPRPPHLEPISAVGTVGTVTQPPFFPTNTSLGGAGIWPENHDFRRWFVRMPPELPAQISPPFLHQIDRVSKKGKKVICARHSPGVGHAQDLARIPKWKLGRAPGARQDFKRRPLRDRSSSDHLGDSAEFSAEVGREFN
ncbi:hypothetical protein Prudu_017457, partial [Prunus dulcis]